MTTFTSFLLKTNRRRKNTPVKKEPKKQVTNIYTSPGTTVVVQDRKGRTRDVDEYNRRYDARDNEFVMDNDTLYIKEKSNPDLDGEWVTGEFDGTQDDYEYAERIIRFRNPRFAISISSPLYWDVVYGPNSWTGMYIPTVCMLMRSRHSVIHSGGIGVMALTAGDGTMAGDGIVLTTLGDILRVIGAAGMAATGVAGMAVAIGDIITTGTVVLAGAGAEVEAVIGQVLPIQTVVLPDKAVTGILPLFVVMVRVPFVPVVLLFGEALQFVQKVVLFVLLVLLIAGELLPGV